MSTLSTAILAKLRKLNAESTLEPKTYASEFDLFEGPCQIIKTRLPKQYIELAITVVGKCDDDTLFDSLACFVTFNADHSDDLRPESQAIVDKLDVKKVGWDHALGMTRKPSPYDLDSIADCMIQLFVLEYNSRSRLNRAVKLNSTPAFLDFDA
jgi:hypothetical protein